MTESKINEMVDKCGLIAIKAHSGQYRRDNKTPYIEHCYEVAKRVRHLGDKYVCVALLHDVLEDTKITANDLLNMNVDEDVVIAVQLLTKHPNHEYNDYLKLIKNNELAMQVKIADILSNLSGSPTLKQIRKYSEGLLFLTE